MLQHRDYNFLPPGAQTISVRTSLAAWKDLNWKMISRYTERLCVHTLLCISSDSCVFMQEHASSVLMQEKADHRHPSTDKDQLHMNEGPQVAACDCDIQFLTFSTGQEQPEVL